MRERANAMRARVLDRFSVESAEYRAHEMLDRTITAALALRDAALPDEHDIDALHPARTVLILMDVARIADPFQLSIGAFLESHDARLAVSPAGMAAVDGEVAAVVQSIPTPLTTDTDDLLEKLLALPPAWLIVALAERLDHARHFHLRPRELWQGAVEVETNTYLPLARRVGGLLGRRYDRWHTAALERLRKRA